MEPYFAFFIVAWIYLRHYLNLRILYSEFTEFKTVGPYELDWAGGQFKCELSHYISTALLASLQSLNLFWLYYILRIAYRIVFLNVTEDDRSDNDDNEFAEEQRLDAFSKSAAERERELADAPQVLVNGQLLNGNGNGNGNSNGNGNGNAASTAAKIRGDGTTNRKERSRKA